MGIKDLPINLNPTENHQSFVPVATLLKQQDEYFKKIRNACSVATQLKQQYDENVKNWRTNLNPTENHQSLLAPVATLLKQQDEYFKKIRNACSVATQLKQQDDENVKNWRTNLNPTENHQSLLAPVATLLKQQDEYFKKIRNACSVATQLKQQDEDFKKIINNLPINLNPIESDEIIETWIEKRERIAKNLQERIAKNSLTKEINKNIPLPENNDINLQNLSEEIQEKLYQGQPELALDRLHTFAKRFSRKICEKYKIDTVSQNGDNLPLHSLIGSLIKKYEKEKEKNGLSEFSITALKMSNSVFAKYNDIRNKQSYAHDNEEILNKNEAQFAVTVIINLLNFIDSIENNQSYTSLFYSPE